MNDQTVGMRPNHEGEEEYYFGGSRLPRTWQRPPLPQYRRIETVPRAGVP